MLRETFSNRMGLVSSGQRFRMRHVSDTRFHDILHRAGRGMDVSVALLMRLQFIPQEVNTRPCATIRESNFLSVSAKRRRISGRQSELSWGFR